MTRAAMIVRTLGTLAPLAVAGVLLASGIAHAQLSGAAGAFSPPFPTIPGTSSAMGGSGIPLGAVELGTTGLSPAPFSTLPGLASPNPGMAALPTAPGNSFGTGLSPSPISPGTSSVAPLATGSGAAPNGIAGFGIGGTQPLPGLPYVTP